jgi:ribosomal protein S18 acetylase RimI-like enzyme
MALQIRESTLADAESITALHVSCWQKNFMGKIEAKALAELPVSEWLERRKQALQNLSRIMLVAELNGKVIGFCDGGAPRDPHYGESGELYALYVDPAAQRKGAGRVLLLEMKSRLGALGYRRMMVKTLAGNPAARGFYSSLGGEERAGSSFMFGGQSYPEVAYVYELD